MAFLRFNRDKRGYEHFSLVEPTTTRRGKTKNRVLYWYRTPPNVRVGREPFDESVRRELEVQNPDVRFDWRKIIETPIPSAEAERWRERRRADRAEKAARRALASEPQQADSEREPNVDERAPAADVEAVTDRPPSGELPQEGAVGRRRRRGRRRRHGRLSQQPAEMRNEKVNSEPSPPEPPEITPDIED